MFKKYEIENREFLIKLKLYNEATKSYNYNSPYMDMAVYLSEIFSK